MSAYRTRTLYITPAHYAALRAFADMHMLDTPEDAAALWLEERIQSDARLLRFEREQRRVMKTLREEAATWEDTALARITEPSK
jgi:uncharacterized protein YcbX